MRVLIREVDNGLTGTLKGAEKLKAQIEPALARGETVELDFEGIDRPYAVMFVLSIGVLIEQDRENRIHNLLRFANLTEIGRLVVDGVVENAIRRRENPRWAEAIGRVAEDFSRRD